MRAVIFCGGEIGDIERVRAHIKDDDMIICADSGYRYAKQMGILPRVVLGDFDSYDKDDVDCKNVEIYPSKKDFTDSEIAVEYAIEKGADEILLLAATGSRVDHTLANIYLLKTLTQRAVRASIFDGSSTIWFAEKEIAISGKKGDLLSIIPFSYADDITTSGLEYELLHQPLPSTGVSNVFVSCEAKVQIGAGEAIVVYTPKECIR